MVKDNAWNMFRLFRVIIWRDKDGDCSTCNNNHNNTSYSKQVAFVIEIVWQLDLYLPMQSVPIAIKFVSSNPTQAMCTQQHYVIKFVSDLWQVGGFLSGISVSSTNKTDPYNITEILLKVTLNTKASYSKLFHSSVIHTMSRTGACTLN